MGLRYSLGLVSGEPQLSLCKMNISCIIRWSRMALQQETRTTALSSSSHLLGLPPSVSYSSCFRLSICLFFCALFCPKFECIRCQEMSKRGERTGKRRRKSIRRGKGTGEIGEGQMSAWGADRKLGQEEKRNKKEYSRKRCHWFCHLSPSCPLTPISTGQLH